METGDCSVMTLAAAAGAGARDLGTLGEGGKRKFVEKTIIF